MSTRRKDLKTDPKLIIDLSDIFGGPIPNSPDLRAAIGQEILDIIVERTGENLDKNEKAFRPKKYSKEYADSLEFQAFGKSRGDVNLRLTGDMLQLMDIVEETPTTLTIGWRDDFQAQKASGHITGANNLPKRDFFGLSEGDIQRLKSEFGGDVERLRKDANNLDFSSFLDSTTAIGQEILGKAAVSEATGVDAGTLAFIDLLTDEG
jgi:hypothetical protein